MNWTIEELNMVRERIKFIASRRTGVNNPWRRIAKVAGCHPHNVKIFLQKGVKYPKLQHRRMIVEANKIITEYTRIPVNNEED